MKITTFIILVLSFSVTQAADIDKVNKVKAKFLVNYKEMCLKGVVNHKPDKEKFEKKCACQVKEFDENFSGDELIKLFTSKDKFQYPELRSKANSLIKKCE